MAKRKRRPGQGAKFRPAKNYRDDDYVPYIFRAEHGILEAWTIDRDIRDGDVREALRGLISAMKKTERLPKELAAASEDPSERNSQNDLENTDTKSFVQQFILNSLQAAFKEYGPLTVEDTVGILTVINNSVGTWNRGWRGQEYLKYIEDFLGG